MKLYIGTANWGKPYGMNQVKVSHEEIQDILTIADGALCGIETAWDYDCLDELEGLGDQFDIIFKADDPDHFDRANDMIGDVVCMKHHAPYKEHRCCSVYAPSDGHWRCDTWEIPLNIVDQRFMGYIDSHRGCIARSVFIQGLAFQMPDFHGIPFYHLCWNFVRNNPNIDGIVVGVDSAKQLEDILSIPQYEIDYSKIGSADWFRKY